MYQSRAPGESIILCTRTMFPIKFETIELEFGFQNTSNLTHLCRRPIDVHQIWRFVHLCRCSIEENRRLEMSTINKLYTLTHDLLMRTHSILLFRLGHQRRSDRVRANTEATARPSSTWGSEGATETIHVQNAGNVRSLWGADGMG